MKTSHVSASTRPQRWMLYDASEHTLGRMAARIAFQLIGKDLPTYTPSESSGTFVVVVNSAKARVTGAKDLQKNYQHYTGYPGGQRDVSLENMRERRPTDIVTLAVRRMLPKNRLGKDMLSRLKVYAGGDHPHEAQQPVKVEVASS